MKSIYIIISICLVYLIIGNYNKEEIIIPNESIRLRIIANSNLKEDQQIKYKVKQNLEQLISNILKETNTLETAKNKLDQNMNLINNNIRNTLEKEKTIQSFNVNLGKNYFPEKEFYGIKYNGGEYESLVVTLGEGKGDNWWCVLFPPLCLIEAEESTETEYRLYVKDVIDKYL